MAGNRRKRTEGQANGKRLNVMMREESIRRLMINVVMSGKNPGDILSDLVDAGLKAWRVQANPVKINDRQTPELQAIESVADMAA
jgi:hypothetical protein